VNTPRIRPLLTAPGLLLALVFAPATSSAQVIPPNFQGQNGTRAPSFDSSPMTRHVLALLFNATQLAPGTGTLDEKITAAFGLGEDTAVLSLGHDSAAGGAEHFFAVSRASDRKEVVIFHVREDGATEAFLCDFSGRLRGAVVVKADGTMRRVSVWRAAGKFQAELAVIGNEVRAHSKRYVHYILAGK